MKKIICTQCGCKTLIRSNPPFDAYHERKLRTYACCECSHLEFFYSCEVDKYYSGKKTIDSIANELQVLEKRLADLESPLMISKINDEVKQLECQLMSLDITIRQKNEFESKLREMQEKSRCIPIEIAELKRKIEALKSRRVEVERNIAHIELIEG